MSAPSASPRRPLEHFSLDGTLAEVASFVPATLVPAPAWAALRRAASVLPGALTRAMYLECRLRHDAAPVDLILRIERDGAAILAGRNAHLGLAGELRDDPSWRAVSSLCERWVAGDDRISRLVSHLWLEFDLSTDEVSSIPRPSLFAGLRANAAASMTDGDALALLDWLGATCGGLDGHTRRTAAEVILRRGAASVPYLGVMAAREVPAVRVYLRGPKANEVTSTLATAGWRHPVNALGDAIGALTSMPGAPGIGMVHVDVAGEPLPRVGVEFALAREPQVRGQLIETVFLDRLVGMGLCSPERRDELLAWPGARHCSLPHELWESVIVRRVNCVKLVSSPDAIEAKGYLLFFSLPAPWSPATCASADELEQDLAEFEKPRGRTMA